MHINKAFIFFLTLFCITTQACSDQDALQKGVMIYNQNDWINSQPYLRSAAEEGNSEAQYFLAEALRLSNRYMTEESQKWYTAAAAQNDLFAMIRLSDSDDLCGLLQKSCKKNQTYWKNRALILAQEQASNGNNLAMHALYYLTGDRGWLKKAADAGNEEAGYFLAELMLSDTRDQKTGRSTLQPEAEKYLKKSAAGNNPKAMILISSIMNERGDYSASKKWLEKCLLSSHYSCLLRFENIHKRLTDTYKNLDYQPNKTIAYGILLFRRDALGKAKTSSIFDTFEDELTAEQKAEGEKFFHEWKKTHPPLSYHIPKLGF